MVSPSAPLHIIVSADPDTAGAALRDALAVWEAGGRLRTVDAPIPETWPFTYPLVPELPAGRAAVIVPHLHEAFVNRQQGGTRLVTTQAGYLMQVWADALAGHGEAVLFATADLESIREHAPEILARKGLFAGANVHVLASTGASLPPLAPSAPLPQAFRAPEPADRLRLCLDGLSRGRSPAALVATASVCMEVNDLDAATRDLEEALGQAPQWAAAHFEQGKLWLRRDDMERAAQAFGKASRCMPTFTPAWANLGGTLGELNRPDEALAAFERALALDPESHQALNNIGVVTRELGRLAESEAAFRKVIGMVPDLAFGHYNLGHTLFLQGRYHAALSAYAEGRKRDPERNPVQATRLAMCRLATGDPAGALRDLEQAFRGLPPEYGQQLAGDTDAIVWALVGQRPDLDGWMTVHEWLARKVQEGRT